MTSPVSASEGNIQLAADFLHQGKLVAIPTETVYGLGGDARNPEAVSKIFAAKGRPVDHPLIVHIADVACMPDWAVEIPQTAYLLAERYWPGALTLVLKKQPQVLAEVTGGQDTIALRIPRHPVALALLKAFGGGIAAPSANRFCRISPTQASHVEQEMGNKVDLILDGGTCEVGLESTIIDLSGNQPMLLRPGRIGMAEIENLLGQKLLLPSMGAKIHAPGMMALHYAPTTTTLLYSTSQFDDLMGDTFRRPPKMGLVCFDKPKASGIFDRIVVMPFDAETYGVELYRTLRELDDAGLDLIMVEQPPQTESWRAVNDRLQKATQPFANYLQHPGFSHA